MDFQKIVWCGWNAIELAIGFIIFYFWGRSWGGNLRSSQWGNLVLNLVGVVAATAFMVMIYGYHYEVEEDYGDHQEGRYVKDFEATREERLRYGSKVFAFFLIASMMGYYEARQKAREKEASLEKWLKDLEEEKGVKTAHREDQLHAQLGEGPVYRVKESKKKTSQAGGGIHEKTHWKLLW